MWNLYEDDKELKPLVFSNGKSQEDVVREVIESIKAGNNIIFIKGVCGSGKSGIALNIARKLGRASIVVPIKSLQEQYTQDYTRDKYVMHNGKRLKICPIVGRQNFKCRFLTEFGDEKIDLQKYYTEKNTKLSDIFKSIERPSIPKTKDTCDNRFLPCTIELKEKNLHILKDYIKQNPEVKFSDFDSIKDIKRMTIAPICPYYSPLLPDDYDIKKFKDAKKIKYKAVNNRDYTFYQRKSGCKFYDQYEAYADADVIIFNSMKYKIENWMNRKPATDVEIIDECDEFLDSFAEKEQINLTRLLFSLNTLFPENPESAKTISKLIDITNALKFKYKEEIKEPLKIEKTLIEDLLTTILENTELLDTIESDESNYLFHLDEVARIFYDFIDETFFSIEKKDNDLIIQLVTTNLAKKFKELVEKNKVFVLMSGTIHSENVLKNIFGLEKFKIVEAETKNQGELIYLKTGYEMNCSYASFNSKNSSNHSNDNNNNVREKYLTALSKTIECAKKPILVHVNAFSDLPTENEKAKYEIENLPTQKELIDEQINDPLGKRINEFKSKQIDTLFTTKCGRGADFPGDICNSIVITRFPYPNISGIFWKILKKTNPQNYSSFYMDKARRELLQKIYRGLRSKTDKVYLLSPDSRVMDFKVS